MSLLRASLALVVLVAVAACSVPAPGAAPDGVHDPYEQTNRKVHSFNRQVDEKVLGRAGKGYVSVVPEGVQENVSNFADTMGLPGTVVNQVLQGRPGEATRNTVRFMINATFGFAGLADVATDWGIPENDSDFGETLAVWGVPEGAYMELPLLGPSTERDTAGIVVDLFTNPLDYVIPSQYGSLGTGAYVLSKVGDRGRFSDTVESIYYDSADSYAQLRLIYLQNRRYELGEDAPADEIDPLELDTEGF